MTEREIIYINNIEDNVNFGESQRGCHMGGILNRRKLLVCSSS